MAATIAFMIARHSDIPDVATASSSSSGLTSNVIEIVSIGGMKSKSHRPQFSIMAFFSRN
jgi:hypothetical protein